METLYKTKVQTADRVWLTEQQACELLGIKKRTLLQYVYGGKITRDMYRVGIGNNRFYDREKLMGK